MNLSNFYISKNETIHAIKEGIPIEYVDVCLAYTENLQYRYHLLLLVIAVLLLLQGYDFFKKHFRTKVK